LSEWRITHGKRVIPLRMPSSRRQQGQCRNGGTHAHDSRVRNKGHRDGSPCSFPGASARCLRLALPPERQPGEAHALVAVETAVRHEDVGVRIIRGNRGISELWDPFPESTTSDQVIGKSAQIPQIFRGIWAEITCRQTGFRPIQSTTIFIVQVFSIPFSKVLLYSS